MQSGSTGQPAKQQGLLRQSASSPAATQQSSGWRVRRQAAHSAPKRQARLVEGVRRGVCIGKQQAPHEHGAACGLCKRGRRVPVAVPLAAAGGALSAQDAVCTAARPAFGRCAASCVHHVDSWSGSCDADAQRARHASCMIACCTPGPHALGSSEQGACPASRQSRSQARNRQPITRSAHPAGSLVRQQRSRLP